MIRHVWHRMTMVGIPVIIATPSQEDRDEIYQANTQASVVCGYGDPNDVLYRYLLTARAQGFDAIMRVTGDCPFVDPDVCSQVLALFHALKLDYCSNDLRPTYPRGMGCEVFTREALERAHQNVLPSKPKDREHVTPWIIRCVRGDYFDGRNVRCSIVGVENLNFSVDTQEDLDRVRAIDLRLPEGHLKYSLETTLQAYHEYNSVDTFGYAQASEKVPDVRKM